MILRVPTSSKEGKMARRQRKVLCAPMSQDDKVAHLRFIAEAGRLKSNRRFTEEERNSIIQQLQDANATSKFLLQCTIALKSGKAYEAIIQLVQSANQFDACDQQLIDSLYTAFTNEFERKGK